MTERVSTVDAAATAFRTLAEAEGAAVPMYAGLCRTIAAAPDLAGLLLEAPTGQRLPVLVLAALHDAVLADPTTPLGAWYPSVGGDPRRDGDLEGALRATYEAHRERVLELVRHRQVQTNEVNRCVGWRAALAMVCCDDPRPLTLLELGASAGLNLAVDRYAIHFDGAGPGGAVGPVDSPVELRTSVRTGAWPGLDIELPEVVARLGLDLHPLDTADPDDARWLTACLWPEQVERFGRLRSAIELTRSDPPDVHLGDLVDDLRALIDATPPDGHLVVLSSWALAYVDRDRRQRVLAHLVDAARTRARRGGRLTLLTLEADRLLPWIEAPPLPEPADAAVRHASLLAATSFTDGAVVARPLARCQAHLVWMDRLSSRDVG